MGLKLLRWVYELGVKNERRRIAQYLANAQAERYDITGYHGFDDRSNLSEKQRRELDRKRAVDADVISIIDGLFRAEEKYVRGKSIIFPEGEERL